MKSILQLTVAVLVSSIALAGKQSATTFYIVGDYGYMQNLTMADASFDQINTLQSGADKGDIDRAEFFVAVGDNIYPAIEDAPTEQEFELMLGLWNRPNLESLPTWAIRGNHDAYFNWTYELLVSMEQGNWMLPSFWYSKLIPAGPNGEFLGLLFVDSVLMTCSNYTAADLGLPSAGLGQAVDPTGCYTELDTIWGNTQWDFINMTLKEWEQNPNIIWKGAV